MGGVDAEQLNLFCSGCPLEDEVSLGFLENQAVDVTIPLKGGKVHGSLARAGKVRGQTPKVEAGEKKKTGRAKRRIQYVRRFVNVVETFGGRKKGPNSNSESPICGRIDIFSGSYYGLCPLAHAHTSDAEMFQ